MRDIGDIQGLIAEINELATSKGWRDNDASKDKTGTWFAAYIALLHGEVSDALEDYRNGVWGGTRHVSMDRYGGNASEVRNKPVGVGQELANVLIRTFDMIDIWNVDIEYELHRAFEYLWLRPYEPCPKVTS